ncbi:MAG: hypothetical protein AAFY41_16025 [Bacteroidota bacterium]
MKTVTLLATLLSFWNLTEDGQKEGSRGIEQIVISMPIGTIEFSSQLDHFHYGRFYESRLSVYEVPIDQSKSNIFSSILLYFLDGVLLQKTYQLNEPLSFEDFSSLAIKSAKIRTYHKHDFLNIEEMLAICKSDQVDSIAKIYGNVREITISYRLDCTKNEFKLEESHNSYKSKLTATLETTILKTSA